MTDKQPENNYAFIDGQNLNAGVEAGGWKLDQKRFREYLRREFNVSKAYIFIGFMEEYQSLYTALQEAGFILHFKPLVRHEDVTIKGNVDADLVLQAMIDYDHYDKAVIVSGDGDFTGLMRHLANNNKLKQLLIPNKAKYSSLFKRLEEYERYFTFIDDHRSELAYHTKRKKTSSSPQSAKANKNHQPNKGVNGSSKNGINHNNQSAQARRDQQRRRIFSRKKAS